MLGAAEFNLVELFWSAQGEGPNVGRSTLFLRFGGCDLRCAWCDSPGTWLPTADCRFEISPGSGQFERDANPVSASRLERAIRALSPAPGSFLGLTGGEPLLQPLAVVGAAQIARALGLRVALETHGLAVARLAEVIGEIDYVSMDWKLESDVRRAKETEAEGGYAKGFAALHAEFLALLVERSVESSVKVVVTGNTLPEELAEVCRVVAALAPETPLILQPVTPFGRVKEQPSAEVLLGHLRACERVHADVRLIPQTHRVYGAL